MRGHPCLICHKGNYEETRITDDWDGVLRCCTCGDKIPRWMTKRECMEHAAK
jgi:hypothetical protein